MKKPFHRRSLTSSTDRTASCRHRAGRRRTKTLRNVGTFASDTAVKS